MKDSRTPELPKARDTDMPIKFRCSSCRQFLGISRGRAGEVVDCPACGRSVRVPGLDGVVAPLPEPELNRADAQLSRALEELGALATEQPPLISTNGTVSEDQQIPQPIPEPIPIEVPGTPEPIAGLRLEPLVLAPLSNQSDAPAPMGDAAWQALAELTRPPEQAASKPESPLISNWSHRPPQGQTPALQSRSTPDAEEPREPVFESPGGSQRHPSNVIVAPRPASTSRDRLFFGVLQLAAVTLGFWLGRLQSTPTATRLNAPDLGVAQLAVEPAAVAGAPGPGIPASAIAVKGRITYQNAQQDRLADAGARVLVIPDKRPGEARLLSVGFRAADQAADRQFAIAAIAALGGGFAIANQQGEFTISLATAGEYRLVVCSGQPTTADAVTDPKSITALGELFLQPVEVIGRVRHMSAEITYRGTDAVLWDHSFPH